MTTHKNKSVILAGTAIFGALSIIISFEATFIPRIPGWGIALFDPISIIWIACFLVFGVEAGIFCSIIGAIGLMYFDPTAPLGPFMKFVATIWHIIIPIVILKIMRKEVSGKHLESLKIYVPAELLAAAVRTAVMIPLNLILVPLFFGPMDVTFIITFTIIINITTAIADIIVPWIIIMPTKIYEKFGMW